MKNKKDNSEKILAMICAVLITSLILFFIFIVLQQEQEFKIYLDEVEVDEVVACCWSIGNVNSFENSSDNVSVGRTVIGYDYSETYCFPEENLQYLEVPCDIIKKEELTIKWLDKNCEDLECNYYNLGCMKFGIRAKVSITKEQYYDPEARGFICTDKIKKCSKYKFGEYLIEVK